jgi:nucleotide-binding universal stress UspA family protein
MKNILVPVDFTEISLKGLDVAVSIAQKTNARIILFNAIQPVGSGGFSTMGGGSAVISSSDRFIVEFYRKTQNNLSQLLRVYEKKNVNIQVSIVINEFKKGICNFVRAHDIDLVVMGTSGENTFSEILDGNHTEQVIRGTNCPVIAVRSEHQSFDTKQVLLITDGKEGEDRQLQYVCQLLRFLDSHVHVLKPSASSNNEQEKQKLSQQLSGNGLNKFSVEVKKVPDFLKAVIEYGQQQNVGLIASVWKGKKGWSRSFSKSMNENLIRKCNIPILSLEVK